LGTNLALKLERLEKMETDAERKHGEAILA
jgi:hypothetical protein